MRKRTMSSSSAGLGWAANRSRSQEEAADPSLKVNEDWQMYRWKEEEEEEEALEGIYGMRGKRKGYL